MGMLAARFVTLRVSVADGRACVQASTCRAKRSGWSGNGAEVASTSATAATKPSRPFLRTLAATFKAR